MNIANFNKLFLLGVVASTFFASCKKAETSPQLGDDGQQIIRVVDYGGTGANFNNAALILDLTDNTPVTVDFKLEFLGAHVFTSDATITVGVNDAARTDFNTVAAAAGETQYEVLPPSAYTLNTTTATIKAGDVFSSGLSITLVDPTLLDPAVSYMFPVSITGISGAPDYVKAGPSTGTAYFHIIGNPLAGTYHSIGYFYHPVTLRDLDEIKVLAPLSPTTLVCDLGDLGTSGYAMAITTDPATNKCTVTAAPGAAGAPYTQFDDGLPTDNPGYTPLWPGSAACNNTYDPATKTFHIRVGYVGATGWRVSEEALTKQ